MNYNRKDPFGLQQNECYREKYAKLFVSNFDLNLKAVETSNRAVETFALYY